MAVQRKFQVGVITAVAMTVTVISVLAASLLMARQTIPTTGDVGSVGVGVYWDNSCTSNVTNINWGTIEPGSAVNVSVYIKNEGTNALKLNVTTENWSPASASNEISLTWNRENYILNPGLVVKAVLTLSVSADITGITSFSFNVVIVGTEYT